MKFEIDLCHRAHRMIATELHGLTLRAVNRVRNFIGRNHSDDPFYQAARGITPFLQGCDGDWVLIEFWCGSKPEQIQKVRDYIELMNKYVFHKETYYEDEPKDVKWDEIE